MSSVMEHMSPREPGESLEGWQWRCVYTGAVWYHNHLKQAIPLVILTEDQQVAANYSTKNVGVFVMMNESASEASTKEYLEYLPIEVLEAGIKAGRFLQGCINVNKHCAQEEAFVSKVRGGVFQTTKTL
ncbi:DIS3 mitotic control [Desmophyllum pertusum]|uniref:DIS3 mitotic control n=1 Tax=Desmophyllum pertusum TaxID=174260 RepID=A0A9W9ZWJ2_9CNID|nr:DIS3 mitotic control [Desmophyllum pertusum]